VLQPLFSCTLHGKMLMDQVVVARAPKRSAIENRPPLYVVGILQRVLSYAGPGHWLFLSTVCSLWRDVYCRVSDKTLLKKGYMDCAKQFTGTPKMTMYSAVFASPSRVRLAHESGLQCAIPAYQYAAGKHGTVAPMGSS
jgi:hypothetical protein